MSDTAVTELDTAVAETADEEIPVLFLHQVERHYRQGDETLHILKGAELAIWAGQSVALVAPSGAGKSTLLHLAGLLEHPDQGEVYIDGQPTSTLADADRTGIRRGCCLKGGDSYPQFRRREDATHNFSHERAGRAYLAARRRAKPALIRHHDLARLVRVRALCGIPAFATLH